MKKKKTYVHPFTVQDPYNGGAVHPGITLRDHIAVSVLPTCLQTDIIKEKSLWTAIKTLLIFIGFKGIRVSRDIYVDYDESANQAYMIADSLMKAGGHLIEEEANHE